MSYSLKVNLILVSLIFLISIIFQNIFLKPHLEYGFSPDDVWLVTEYRLLGENKLLYLNQVWARFGPYFTSPIFYIGILSEFFGNNHYYYQLTSHIFKHTSGITLFFLILVLFSNRAIAFLSAVIFILHYSSVGSLEMVVRNMDYLAITLMNLFLVYYYYLIKGKLSGIKWLFLGSLFLVSCFAINPIRMYPLLAFIVLIEVFLVIFRQVKIKDSVKRVAILFSPFFLVFLVNPKIVLRYMTGGNASTIAKFVYWGNLHLLVSPVTSLGSMFLPRELWGRVPILTESFNQYLGTLLKGVSLIIIGATFVISLVSQKKKIFFALILVFTFVLFVSYYFIATAWTHAEQGHQHDYNYGYIVPTLLGMYSLLAAFFLFLEGYKKKNKPLILAAAAILFSFVFILCTWVLGDYNNVFTNISGYLTIPSVGISVFLAALVYEIYISISKKSKLFKIAILLTLFVFFIMFFVYSSLEIKKYFSYDLKFGMRSSDQIEMARKFKIAMRGAKVGPETLIYLDGSDDYDNGRFYTQIFIDRFDYWMVMNFTEIKNPCQSPTLVTFGQKEQLLKSFTKGEGIEGFKYNTSCQREKFFDMNNFYAFKLKDKQFVNIKNNFIATSDLSRLKLEETTGLSPWSFIKEVPK